VVFYAAHLGCSAIGFDIDDLVVRCSYHARQHLMKTDALLLKAPAVLLKADVFRVQSLEPATHAFSFFGHPGMVNATARVVASSASVVWFAAVAPHSADLGEAGLLNKVDGRVKVLPGIEMTVSGDRQTAFIIEMTLDRRQRVLAATAHVRKDVPTPDVDFTALAGKMLASEATYVAHAANWILEPEGSVRPKRHVVHCSNDKEDCAQNTNAMRLLSRRRRHEASHAGVSLSTTT
jgi:hypothetical protein